MYKIVRFLLFVVFVLVIVATFLFKLETVPKLHGDEGATGVQAFAMVENYSYSPFQIGWAEHPLVSFSLQRNLILLFGKSIFSLRLGSVIFAIFTVVLFYFLVRQYVSHKVAVYTTGLLAFSYWYLFFARFGTSYGHIIPLQVASYLLLVRSVSTTTYWKKLILVLLAGLISTSGIYFYHAGRVMPILIFICLVWFLVSDRVIKLGTKIVMIAIFLLIASLAASPFLYMLLVENHDFLVRNRDVLIFPHIEEIKSQYKVDTLAEVLVVQTINSLKVYFLGGDNSEQFGYQGSLLVFPLSLFVPLGIVVFLIKKTREAIPLMFWSIAIMILGSIITWDPYPPFVPRTGLNIVPFFIFIGIFIDYLSKRLRVSRRQLNIILSLLFVLISVYSVRVYFIQYGSSLYSAWANFEPATDIGTYLRDNAYGKRAFFLQTSQYYPTQGNILFIANNVELLGGYPLDQILTEAERGKTIVILLPYRVEDQRYWWELQRKKQLSEPMSASNYEDDLEVLKSTYPQGKSYKFFRSDGSLNYVVYEF